MKAPQVAVTFPENDKAKPGFVSIAQYPRGFEPEDYEFGMLLMKDGHIECRLFSCDE